MFPFTSLWKVFILPDGCVDIFISFDVICIIKQIQKQHTLRSQSFSFVSFCAVESYDKAAKIYTSLSKVFRAICQISQCT